MGINKILGKIKNKSNFKNKCKSGGKSKVKC